MKLNILDAQRQVIRVSLMDIKILGILPEEVKVLGIVDIGCLNDNDKMTMHHLDYRQSFGVVIESCAAVIAPSGTHYMYEPIQDFLRRWLDITKADGDKIQSELARLGL